MKLLAVVFVCTLATGLGHRIQPSPRITKETTVDNANAPNNAAAADAGDSSNTKQEMTFSLVQESSTSVRQRPGKKGKKGQMEPEQPKPQPKPKGKEPEPSWMDKEYFGLTVPILGIIAASVLVLLICLICCLCCKRKAVSLTRQQHIHNGRVVYEWDQNPKVANLYLKPPEGVTKDDLDIYISAKHIRVGRKHKPSFLTEETYDRVNEERSYWTLQNGELQIVLRKATRGDWPSALVHSEDATD
mmetsp:Transcript_104136/g.189630  ORF Transcript_104136/g.189630 Transcript_104136/m.189630 type:complete len:245 (+) Transcript_104136:116-850(+)